MGIAAEILSAVVSAGEKAGAARTNSVRVTVGELTAVVPESLQFAWEALTPGTLAEGSLLAIEVTPARSRCLACGAEFGHHRFDRRCPSCRSFLTEVVGGDELRIDDVDVDLTEGAVPEETRSDG